MGCVTSKPTNQTECVICYDKAEKVLFPCGHFCLCDNCNNRLFVREYHLFNNNEYNVIICPICRSQSMSSFLY